MKRSLLFSAIALIVSFGTMAYAQNQVPEFSAVYVEKDGDTVERGKIYISNNMTRYDRKNGEEILVIRYDKKVMWTIYPKLKRYVEDDYPMAAPIAPPDKPKEGQFGDLTRKFVEYEEIDTYRMKKYLVTILLKGNAENQYSYYEWYRDNFPLPVKTAAVLGNSSYEFTKIKIGKPPIEVFMEPKSYKKVTNDEIEALEIANKTKNKSNS